MNSPVRPRLGPTKVIVIPLIDHMTLSTMGAVNQGVAPAIYVGEEFSDGMMIESIKPWMVTHGFSNATARWILNGEWSNTNEMWSDFGALNGTILVPSAEGGTVRQIINPTHSDQEDYGLRIRFKVQAWNNDATNNNHALSVSAGVAIRLLT